MSIVLLFGFSALLIMWPVLLLVLVELLGVMNYIEYFERKGKRFLGLVIIPFLPFTLGLLLYSVALYIKLNYGI